MDHHIDLNHKLIGRIIKQSLDEDIGAGDVTTDTIVSSKIQAMAEWVSKDHGVISGLDIARSVFQHLDPQLQWEPHLKDGDQVFKGNKIVTFRGSCRAILTAERTALNFSQRMSGIATQTQKAVKLLEGYKTQIVDTRKTVPGLRMLDKYAVLSGGGKNHRMGLFDMAMIKDNHIVAAGGIREAVKMIRNNNPGIKIEVETTTLDQVEEALQAGVDIVMLDNMDLDTMKSAVKLTSGKALTEASGNITIENIQKIAETEVEYISSGALTHSVQAFDISQQIVEILK